MKTVADHLNVIVVQVEETGRWDVSCFNEICGHGLHGVGESDSKGKADAMAKRHRLEISRQIAAQEERAEQADSKDWRARALKAEERAQAWRERAEQAEAAIARVRAQHTQSDHYATCKECSEKDYPYYDVAWPCPTIAALEGIKAGD
jgi:hypothetical protein